MPYQCDPCVCPEQHYRDSMSWRKAMITLLCRIAGYVSGSTPPTDITYFEPIDTTVGATITGAYAVIATYLTALRSLTLDNQTDGNVTVSMDGGAHDHYILAPGQVLSANFFDIGKVFTGQIAVKTDAVGITQGNFYIYGMR